MRTPVYLDYAATTPVDPRVAKVMLDCLTIDGNFANPASRSHVYGWRAEEAVEEARGHLAQLIGADPREIVWTSGATESNNLALKGVIDGLSAQASKQPRHIITSAIEHKAVLDACCALENRGVSITYLVPDASGHIDPDQVATAIGPNTCLVSLMMVNNELGVKTDIAAIGKLCRQRGVLLHVDAAQAVGKELIDVKALDVDLLSISAHKMYGPKGIGALYVRRAPEVNIAAQIHGGGHERGMRSGTLPTHQIVGFGEAARIAQSERESEQRRIAQLRQQFWQGVRHLPGVSLNGDYSQSSKGILNIQFAGVDGEQMMIALRDLAISSGSACTSASMAPSYVLKAIGVSDAAAYGSLRFSFGRFTTAEEIDFATQLIAAELAKLAPSTHSL